MKVEIERKFLLKNDLWKQQVKKRLLIRQGYFPGGGKELVSRIRIAGDHAALTIKAPGRQDPLSRLEYEYSIPLCDAEELLNEVCMKPAIEKYRNFLPDGNFVWEIDEFLGENAGLVLAEIELPEPNTLFPHRGWLGKEVTCDARYTNFSLAKNPWSLWKNNL